MIKTDRDMLMCDLAETYHVFDLEGLPVSTLATLSFGLRDNSRIKMKLSKTKLSLQDTLLAMAVDKLSLLWWAKTKDSQKGRNKPQMILDILTNEKEQYASLKSGEEFRNLWQKITEGGNNE